MKSGNWTARVVEDDGTVVIVASRMTESWARTWLAVNVEDDDATGPRFSIHLDGWGSREPLSGL